MSESSILVNDGTDEEYIACELCREPIHELSLDKRQAHYEEHFNNGDGLEVNELDAQLAVGLAQASSPPRGAPTTAGHWYSVQRGSHSPKPRENVFWHTACPLPPPSRIITPGIIPLLRQALERSGSGGALCTPSVVHYGTELWDLGCALAAQEIRPEYRALLMGDACGPPGVRNLQVWIEDAWRRGYDTHGAAQLRHHLVGTRKWIGTAAHTALIQWLTTHFMEHSEPGSTSVRGVFMSTRMPVVLQHKGHSRTVIGVEFVPSGETNVLIYDPARRPSAALRKAGLCIHATSQSVTDPHPAPVPVSEQRQRRNSSPQKAKEFLKRVIKKRSRTPVDEQASKRVRGGSMEPDDWEAMGKGKGRRLGGDGDDDPQQEGSARRGRGGHALVADAAQGLDLGRVLGAFRVSASQLGKKDQYQLLWFPMTAALTGLERDTLKIAVEAKKKCPNLMAVHVATYKEGESEPRYWDDPSPLTHKVSLDHYRRESARIFKLFQDTMPAGGEIVFIDYTVPVRTAMLERYPELELPSGPFDLDTPLPPPPEHVDWTSLETNVIPVSAELPKDEKNNSRPVTPTPGADPSSTIDNILSSGPSTPRSDSTPLPSEEPEPGSDAPPTWHDIALSIGAEFMRTIRDETCKQLGYTLSAGIARNKMLAKLSASYRKPMAQSVLRNVAIPGYLGPMPFQKIRFLGGKLGDAMAAQFEATTVAELKEIDLEEMQRRFGEESIWVWNVLR
ncbi:DNA-directed DNA polymerase eta rad30, partial [Ceratobasidium sp. 392]